MRLARCVTLALVAAALLSACGDTAGTEPAEGATLEDYCDAVHDAWNFAAAATSDGGVRVTWDSQPTGEPVDFVVYRRVEGTEEWERRADVTIDDGDPMAYVDRGPVDLDGRPLEYTVTRVMAECGGESELCVELPCDPPATVAPRKD
ncbi:hypothetical protein GXB85_16665 [Cellulomonas sp. APG4]|uniref:hypothetical protein n=1 Tax=Cellulomonas sp. APG4 TaxID=1538656 RepID=UPI00137A3DE3|nr:hypothetical protein [Cellulomonas sp. APG4]NCT92568.1 hypothetical protein [Cellulomonas sp. APG4]